MAFEETESQCAYFKAAVTGFAGTGKTTLARNFAIGLHRYCVERGTMSPGAPVMALDTEVGIDFQRPAFREAGIRLLVDKARNFTRLVPAIKEAEDAGGILIVDSITAYWSEIQEAYMARKGRTAMRFDDWRWVKSSWASFTTAFTNSACHIILCGRAGWEYDFQEDDAGKRELVKTGVKLRAESDLGYEPSLLVLMDRHMEMKEGAIQDIYRTGMVLKDRAALIDGQVFRNPTFNDFLPHVESLNLGGTHVGVDVSKTSASIIPPDSKEWRNEKQEREIVLDEIQQHLIKLYPSQSVADKTAKTDLIEQHFGTRSWKKVEGLAIQDLRAAYRALTGQEQIADRF